MSAENKFSGMTPNRATGTRPPSPTGPEAPDERNGAVRSEDLHVRSYAHDAGYDLEIEVVDDDGSVAFRDRYYLQPGAAKSEVNVVPDGEYEVRAVLDGDSETARRCRIGSDLAETAVVEVGNGILSLTEGLRLR
jgi:hypothetical protein